MDSIPQGIENGPPTARVYELGKADMNYSLQEGRVETRRKDMTEVEWESKTGVR